MFFSHAKAQETLFNLNDSTPSKQQKLITNARSLAIGNIELLDTYLSNQKYRGTELRFISQSFMPYIILSGESCINGAF